MSKPIALLIDLDDTLFSEHDYALSGYEIVSEFLSQKYKIDKNEIYQALEYQFYKFGRNGAFEIILKKFAISNQEIGELVGIYRNHIPNIKLYENVETSLSRLKSKFKLAIVTDGTCLMQKHKVKALNISQYFDTIVYCDEIGEPKPSVKAYLHAAQNIGVDIKNCAIIGDDPHHDGKAANDLGIEFLRVLTGRFAKIASKANIKQYINFAEVCDYLENFN